jgi:serine/threonine-protein kinase
MQRAPVSVLRPGELVAGRYRVEGLVGQGGFGAVFKAMQLPMNRAVAIKVVLPHAATNAEVRARFRRESELAQRLEHPNTVRLYDFGETDDGLPFIVWEYLTGRPLDAILKASGAQGVERAARIGGQILKSLMEAHEKGIIHRDIKPSNVFLCDFSGERDFVKVLDFGIAKAADGQQVTRGGTMLGTPAYMSPEQVAGGEITAASDTYALGLVLAEIIVGQPVFAGDTALGIAMRQLSDDPAQMPSTVVDSRLGPVIVRATQKKVDARFSSAGEMLAALEAVEPGWLRASGRRPAIAGAAEAEDSANATSGPTRESERELAASAATVSASSGVSSAPPTSPSPVDEPPPAPKWSVIPPTRDDPGLAVAGGQATAASRTAASRTAASGVSHRALFLGGAGAVLTVLLVSLIALLSGGPKPDATTSHDKGDGDSRAEPRPDRPTNHKRLSTLTSRDVRARLEHLGYRVVAEQRGEPPVETVWVVALGGDQANVVLARYSEMVVGIAESQMQARGFAVARDGTTILGVTGGRNPKRIADAFR